jgi:peptidoglycan/xylan/chitin deacetylase (PgdA/CDA1 family)
VTQLPILMYHRVSDHAPPGLARWCVTPQAFAAQLDLLAGAGFETVRPAQVRDAVLAARPLPARSVWLTFDDGYADLAGTALPALRERGMTATVFLVCDRATNAWDDGSLALLDWDAVRGWAARGIDFGAHTATHAKLTALDAASARAEVLRCRTAIARELGRVPEAFAYPYGLADEGVRQIVAACGFELGLLAAGGPAELSGDPMALARIEVGPGLARSGLRGALGPETTKGGLPAALRPPPM